jgi:hypothetical protein
MQAKYPVESAASCAPRSARKTFSGGVFAALHPSLNLECVSEKLEVFGLAGLQLVVAPATEPHPLPSWLIQLEISSPVRLISLNHINLGPGSGHAASPRRRRAMPEPSLWFSSLDACSDEHYAVASRASSVTTSDHDPARFRLYMILLLLLHVYHTLDRIRSYCSVKCAGF